MKQFTFLGPDTNLGRFGPVRKNDTLTLTDDEAKMIERDKDRRFKAVKDDSKLPKPGHFIELTPEMTQVQRDAATAANKAEEERIERLSLASDTDTVEITEVKQMDWTKLVETAEKLNAEHKVGIEITKTTSKPHLIEQILNARRVLKESPRSGAQGAD